MKSHNEQILTHLKEGNSITQMDALMEFQCFRLGARIYDLKQDGHSIVSEMVEVPSGKRVARYSLVSSQSPETSMIEG